MDLRKTEQEHFMVWHPARYFEKWGFPSNAKNVACLQG